MGKCHTPPCGNYTPYLGSWYKALKKLICYFLKKKKIASLEAFPVHARENTFQLVSKYKVGHSLFPIHLFLFNAKNCKCISLSMALTLLLAILPMSRSVFCNCPFNKPNYYFSLQPTDV